MHQAAIETVEGTKEPSFEWHPKSDILFCLPGLSLTTIGMAIGAVLRGFDLESVTWLVAAILPLAAIAYGSIIWTAFPRRGCFFVWAGLFFVTIQHTALFVWGLLFLYTLPTSIIGIIFCFALGSTLDGEKQHRLKLKKT